MIKIVHPAKILLMFFVLLASCGGESVGVVPVVSHDVPLEDVDDVVYGPFYTDSKEASSELPYDESILQNYDVAQIDDNNFASSWCSSKKDSHPSVTFHSDSLQNVGTVGIMPGFARGEEIFFQNNRIKTINVFYNGSDALGETLDFIDEYKMQFFELNQKDVESITFLVTDTYPGAKYADTCISEIDFKSDFVVEKDADAAMKNYQDNPELIDSARTCPDGNGWSYEGDGRKLVKPVASNESGVLYSFEDLGFKFVIPTGFQQYSVFTDSENYYGDGILFNLSSDPGCTSYGDGTDPWITSIYEYSKCEDGYDAVTGGVVDFANFSANVCTEKYLGGNLIKSYEFELGGNLYRAGALYCDHCVVPNDDGDLIEAVLNNIQAL